MAWNAVVRDRSKTRCRSAGLALAGVAELLFEAGITIMANNPAYPLAYRNGGLADSLAVSAYLLLSLGLLAFPLASPLFAAASGETDAARGSEAEPEPELERLRG
jgi:hypothetical protein